MRGDECLGVRLGGVLLLFLFLLLYRCRAWMRKRMRVRAHMIRGLCPVQEMAVLPRRQPGQQSKWDA